MPRAALDVAKTGEVQMKKLGKGLLCAGLCAACLVPVRGEAAYSSGADTGVEVLDYIENERRSRRENQLTEDQLRLMEDAKEMRANLRQPLSTDANAPLPVAIEGDDLFYDQRTGDVYAKGAVKITELDAKRFTTDEARGNLKQQEVRGCPYVLFFEPASVVDRIANPYALFSVCSDVMTAVDALPFADAALRRIIIPAAVKLEIRDKLDYINISERMIYPGLDGICKWITRRFADLGPRYNVRERVEKNGKE